MRAIQSYHIEMLVAYDWKLWKRPFPYGEVASAVTEAQAEFLLIEARDHAPEKEFRLVAILDIEDLRKQPIALTPQEEATL